MTESQVVATLAALVGGDYEAAVPRAGVPIGDVLTSESMVAGDMRPGIVQGSRLR